VKFKGLNKKIDHLPLRRVLVDHEISQDESCRQADTFRDCPFWFLLERQFINFCKSQISSMKLTICSFAMLNSIQCLLIACIAASPAFWMFVGPFIKLMLFPSHPCGAFGCLTRVTEYGCLGPGLPPFSTFANRCKLESISCAMTVENVSHQRESLSWKIVAQAVAASPLTLAFTIFLLVIDWGVVPL
jgi:hypothetical protein